MKNPNSIKPVIHTPRLLALLLAAITFAAVPSAHGAARTASVSGNWSSTATWGGSAVPVAADTVTINAGVTVTVDTPATCTSISILAPNTVNGLVISGANSLTVSGAISTALPAADNRRTTIAVGQGALSAGSIALAGTSNALRYTELTLGSGTITVSGNITSAGIASKLIFTGSGTVNVGGTFLTTAATFTPATGTVNYTNAANQTVRAYAYHNLVLSGGGNKSMAAGTSVAGNLSIAPTGTAKASVAAGQNLPVDTLTLGGVLQLAGTWGSTASSAANKNDTFFAATTGYLTAASGALLISPLAATAQSYYAADDRAPGHAIDGTGMTPNAPVTTNSSCGTAPGGNMWLSNGNQDTWITFDLGSVQTIAGFHLWNYNENSSPGEYQRGVQTAGIYAGTSLPTNGADYYTQAGANWGTLVQNMTFTQAPGTDGYTGEGYLFTNSVTTRYLQIHVTSNFGFDNYTGISEIRFIPAAQILSFGANVAGSSAAIDQASKTIAWTVPYGTNLATLAPTYTLSSGSCNRTSGSIPSPNFSTGPVTYTVTDGAVTNVYTVTVTQAPPRTACDLLAFNANLTGAFANILPAGSGTGPAVVVHVPAATTDSQLQSLVPTLSLSPGATCPIPAPPLSRTAPVHYIVTAEDGVTTKDYSVTVSFDAEGFWSYAPWTGDADSGITSASPYTMAVNCGGGATTVNGVAFEANSTAGTNFTISGANSVWSGPHGISGDSSTLATDFICNGDPCIVTLKNLTVGATYELSLFAFGYDAAPANRRQDFESGGAHLIVDQNLYGYGNGIRLIHTFVADATTRVVTINPIEGPTFHMSALANRKLSDPAVATIVQFGTNIAGGSTVISQPTAGAATIAWTLPYGTDVTSLAPTYLVSSGAGTPVSGSPGNFSSPVNYTVTDGATTNVYTVTVTFSPPSTACDLLAFNPNLAGSRATILPTGPNSGTLVVNVPAGTTNPQLAALAPTFTLSPHATCVTPTPPLSLSAPVHYIVTAQDGVTTKDYTATVVTNAEDFRMFVVKTAATGLAAADYDYLSLVPVSRHTNKGLPAVFTVANETDFTTNIYLQDYLRRYRPSSIHTINFSATVPNFSSSAINAAGPLELSVAMATSHWTSSAKVVLVSDAVNTTNYPNVLQASALAAALDAPMIYYNAAKETQVQNAITQLGATEVVYVNAAGTKPAMANLVLNNPAAVVNYLAGKNITVDYFAAANPLDLNLLMGSKMSLTAPFLAARRNGIVVPITSYTPNTSELFHESGYPVISAELRQLYQNIGRHPEYLALVGSPTAIPLSYTAGTNRLPNQILNSPTDRDYANADDDLFPDIAIGRIMAFNIFDATLYTCRISTYDQLFDGDWERSYSSRTRSPGFENHGYLFKEAKMKDAGAGKPFNSAFFGHGEHSAQSVLGGFFSTGSTNVLAPMWVSSGGCTVTGIDFETIVDEYNNPTVSAGELIVANTLVRLGAVAFTGCTRLADAWTAQMFGMFGVEALKGEPLGKCYQKAAAQNIMGLDYWFMDQGRKFMLLGDPAFALNVPSSPQYALPTPVITHESASQDLLTLTAVPYNNFFRGEHTEDHIREWGQTPPLYYVDSPGIYDDGGGTYIHTLRLNTNKPIASVTQLDSDPAVPAGLGGSNTYSIDHNQDGTMDVIWNVSMHDWDWIAGVVNKQVTNIQFRITYDLVPDITSFNANLPGSDVLIQSQSDTAGTVTIYVPPGTTDAQIAALAPTYTLDFGATCNQPNNAVPTPPLSVGTPVSYIVSPAAGSSQPPKVYSVSVVRSPFNYAVWTGDADSGISSASLYTVAVNCGGSAVTVNGVAFEAQPQNYPWSGANYTIEGSTSGYGGGTPNLTGNSLTLGADFMYDNPPYTVTLTNLTPGKTYETTFFSYGFGAAGRTQVFASGSDSRVIDQDVYGAGNGIRITYEFVASSSTKVITITPAAGATGTFHLCALANRKVSEPPPTLPSSAIVDDKSGGPVTPNTLVIYTLTFSQDMDASTVTAADFGNAGTSAVSIGTVTETAPGVFAVQATPTTAGTLKLKVNAGAVLNSASGMPLDTAAAIADDTTLTVNNTPPVATPQSVTTSYNTAKAITLAGTDPDGSPLTYVVVTQPTKGTLTGTAPNLTYTPNTNYGGPDSFTFKVNDGTVDSSPATVSITVGLPLPWSGGDIGTGMLAGSLSYNAGTFTQAGSGTIGSTSDKLNFTYQTLSGDGEIIARISVLQDTGTSSRVGVMIRDSLAANSKQIFMGMTGTGAYRWLRRTTTGGTTSSTSSSTGTVPNTWVRLVRSGTTITAYKSTNGTSWTSVGSTTNTTFATTCYIGLAVSSGSNTTLNTSQFTNVTVVP
jgi:hypothetical protein